MAREDLEIIWQRQQLGAQTVVKDTGHLGLSSREVRPADGADEQCIAGDDEPGFLAAPMICHEQTDTLRRMTWRVQYLDLRIADVEVFAIPQESHGVSHQLFGCFMQAILRAHRLCE